MHRTARRLAAAIAMTLLATSIVAPSAQAMPAAASASASADVVFPVQLGRYNGPGQLPVGAIPGACVTAYADDDTVLGQKCNDGTPNYDLTLPPGVPFRLFAEAPGYVSAWAPSVAEKSLAVRYQAGGSVVDSMSLKIYLTPGAAGSIAGRLTDQAGQPVAGATVTFTRRPEAAHWATLAVTDAEGRYRVTNVPPGTFRASFGAEGPADRVAVTAGAETTLDWQFTVPVGVVVLKLTDAVTGKPVDGTCPNFVLYICATTGEHRLAVKAGTVRLVTLDTTYLESDPSLNYFHLSGRPYFAASAPPVEVVAGTTTVTLAVEPAAWIRADLVPRAGGGWTEVCLYAIPVLPWNAPVDLRFRNGEFRCAGPGNPTTRLGPLPLAGVKLFVAPRKGYGAQWVGAAGGVGDQRLAKVFSLHQGANFVDPIQVDRGHVIHAAVWDLTANQPATGCLLPFLPSPYLTERDVFPSEGVSNRCHEGLLDIEVLGPYEWPIRFAGTGLAAVWSGNVTRSDQAQLIKAGSLEFPGLADLETVHTGRISTTPAEVAAVFYDAFTGDRLPQDSLRAGPVFVSFTLAGKNCWYSAQLRRITPASRTVTVPPALTRRISLSASTCSEQAPELLSAMPVVVPPRRPGTVLGLIFRLAQTGSFTRISGRGGPAPIRPAQVQP